MTHPAPGCRYDRDADTYLLPAHRPGCRIPACTGCLPCTHTDDGIPVRHCTARTHCANHLAAHESKTCSGCIAETARHLNAIDHHSGQLLLEALHDGLDSEAAMLAGPAYNTVDQFEADHHRVMSVLTGRIAGDVEPHSQHPVSVLGLWTVRLRATYNQPSTLRITVPRAVAYLRSILNCLAQDPNQDWADFANNVRTCRRHLEQVLHDSRNPETGAACPICTTTDREGPALQHRYGHWCLDPDCTELHDKTGASDRWVCPRNPTHQWRDRDYQAEVADRYLELSPWLTAAQITEKHQIPTSTVYALASKGLARRKLFGGRTVYNVADIRKARATEGTA